MRTFGHCLLVILPLVALYPACRFDASLASNSNDDTLELPGINYSGFETVRYYEVPEEIEGLEYHVGPGQEYEHINDVPWLSLSAGDMVMIHAREEPYAGIIGISSRGSAEAPIRIYGVRDANGNLPVLTGENAVVSDQFDDFFNEYTRGLGVIVIVASYGNIPMHIEIANLVLRRAHAQYEYTDSDGTRNYTNGASGVWMKAKNVKVMGCKILENGNGIFSQANSNEFNEISSDILIESCAVYGNGVVDSELRHNLYLQGVKTTVQYCSLGPLVQGAEGSTLKDRSAGTIIRYNRIESTARAIDLVEPEDTEDVLMARSDFDETFVYGNILINEGSSTRMIHYGYDNARELSRDGTLYFYNNSVYIRSSQETNWRVNLFDININESRVVLYNNIIFREGNSALNLLSQFGTVEIYGGNWISEGWYLCREGNTTNPHGTINEVEDFVEGNDPGFQDPESRDFSLTALSPARGLGTVLDSDLTIRYPVMHQFSGASTFSIRPSMENSGALE